MGHVIEISNLSANIKVYIFASYVKSENLQILGFYKMCFILVSLNSPFAQLFMKLVYSPTSIIHNYLQKHYMHFRFVSILKPWFRFYVKSINNYFATCNWFKPVRSQFIKMQKQKIWSQAASLRHVHHKDMSITQP